MPKTLEKKAPTKTRTPVAKGKGKVEIQPIEHAEAVEDTGPVCAHHWVIATPDGEMSTGRCKVCGTVKEFPNSADDYLWERSVPQSRWTGRSDGASSVNSGY